MLRPPPADKIRQFTSSQCSDIGKIAGAFWFRAAVSRIYPSTLLAKHMVDITALSEFAKAPPEHDTLTVFVPFQRHVHAVKLDICLTSRSRDYLLLPLRIWKSGPVGARLRLDHDHAARLQRIAENRFGFRFTVKVTA